MIIHPVSQPITAAEFELMPDTKGYELVGGRLKEKTVGAFSSQIAIIFYSLLLTRFDWRRHGWIFDSECGYQCWPQPDSNRVRKPDISFVAKGRLPQVPHGWIKIAPDLAIEILSKNDRPGELEEKVAEYQEAGVKLVWVIDPEAEEVRVFCPSATPITLTGAEELHDDAILPGFRCQVSEIFPPRE